MGATLRYSAKLTLGAHLPGNGMGGSTKPTAIDSPKISTSGVTACGVNQVGVAIGNCAASGCTAQKAGAPKNEKDFEKPLCCNIAANQPANLATNGVRPKVNNFDAGAGMGYVEWNLVGATAEARLKSKNIKGVTPTVAAAVAVNKITQDANAGLTYPKSEQYTQSSTTGLVSAPVSGCTNLRANALGVGNSLAWSDISQFPVARVANAASGSVCKGAYKTTLAAPAVAAGQMSGQRNALGASAIASSAATALNGAAKNAPTLEADTNVYCIGPSVGYLTPYYIGSNWASEAAVGKTKDAVTTAPAANAITIVGPGYLAQAPYAPTAGGTTAYASTVGTAAGTVGGMAKYQTLRAPTNAAGAVLTNADHDAGLDGVKTQGLNPNTLAVNEAATWVKAGGVNYGARQNFAYLTSEITVKATHNPTPVGQAVETTNGAADRAFLYARLSPDEIQFAPIDAGLNGGNMGGEDSFACTDGGSDTGADNTLSGKTGNKAAENGKGGAIKNQLEGLAFWQIIAGQMAVAKPANVPKDNAGNDLTLSKVHENCASNIQAMLTFNTAAVVKNTNSQVTPSQTSVKGNQPNAISFPTWKVAIGTKPTGQDFNYYVVPNGFCYVNQCLATYLNSVTQDKGAGFGKLINSPNMGAPTAGKNCGLANGACGSISLFRTENLAPLSYKCSKLGGTVAGTIPDSCGETRWKPVPFTEDPTNRLIYWSGSTYANPYKGVDLGTANTFIALG